MVFWDFANACIKLAILFFYRRIFITRAFRTCTWVLVASTLIWLVYAVLAWLLYCGTDLQRNFEGGWFACPVWGILIQLGVFVLDSLIDICLLFPTTFLSAETSHWETQTYWHTNTDLTGMETSA